MGCKDSTTNERVKSCRFRTSSKSKPWQPSARQVQKRFSRKDYERAKALTIGGKFRRAFSKDHSHLNDSDHSEWSGNVSFVRHAETSLHGRRAQPALLQPKTGQSQRPPRGVRRRSPSLSEV